MITDHKKYDLFGKTVLQKVVLKPPFKFTFPITDNACFLYMLEGGIQCQADDEQINIPQKYSLLLNCIDSGKQVSNSNHSVTNEIVIVNFHPDILKKIYDREMPLLLQAPKKIISNKSTEVINNDYLIEKYVEGVLFYFKNPQILLLNVGLMIWQILPIASTINTILRQQIIA